MVCQSFRDYAAVNGLTPVSYTHLDVYKRQGFSANWQLQPPTMPSAEMMFSAALRSIWYSLSERVSAGADVYKRQRRG